MPLKSLAISAFMVTGKYPGPAGRSLQFPPRPAMSRPRTRVTGHRDRDSTQWAERI